MEAARIELLGGVRILFPDGRRVDQFRRRKTALLLAYLALYQQRTHFREALTEMFWPELSRRMRATI